jgi:ribosomal protein S18 acetylase RimI-like enzyme
MTSNFDETDTIIVRLLPAAFAHLTFEDAFFCTCNTCEEIRGRERRKSGGGGRVQQVPAFVRGFPPPPCATLPTTVIHFDAYDDAHPLSRTNRRCDMTSKGDLADPDPEDEAAIERLVHSAAAASSAAYHDGASLHTPRNRLLLAQIEAFHEHCLPVQYDDKFYTWLQHGENHVTLLAMQRVQQRRDVSGLVSDSMESDLLDMRRRLDSLMGAKKKQQQQQSAAKQSSEEAGDESSGAFQKRGDASLEKRQQEFTKPFFPSNTGMRMVRHDFVSPSGDRTRFDPLLGSIDVLAAAPCSHGFAQIRGLVVDRIVPPSKPEPLIASSSLLAGRGAVTPPRSREALGALVYIATLGVRNDSRGKGLATELVRRSLEESSGLVPCVPRPARQMNLFRCNRVFLHCLDTNFAALRLYANLGFEVTDSLPSYYFIDGEWRDAVVLTRPIAAAAPSALAATGVSPLDMEEDAAEDDDLRRRAKSLDGEANNSVGGNFGVAAMSAMGSKQSSTSLSSAAQQQQRPSQPQVQTRGYNNSGGGNGSGGDASSDWTGEVARAGMLLAPAAIAGAVLFM